MPTPQGNIVGAWPTTASIRRPERSLPSDRHRHGFPFKGYAPLKFFRGRPFLEHIGARRYTPQTNGVVKRFNQSLKYKHLHRLEINQARKLAQELEAFLQLYNKVRPHEALGFRRPREIYRLDPHLFSEENVQEDLTRDPLPRDICATSLTSNETIIAQDRYPPLDSHLKYVPPQVGRSYDD